MTQPATALERAVLDRNGRWEGSEIRFRCPFPERHQNGDANPSARYNPEKGVWFCDACENSGGRIDLAKHLGVAAQSFEDRIAATYPYTDEAGALLYEVVRLANPKSFRQRRPDGRGGWIWNMAGARRVLYRLQDTIAAIEADRRVFVVEGEKDADRLAALGLDATTNAGGAGKWIDAYSGTLVGARVAILPDNDEAGRRHAEKVAKALHGRAREVKVVELPGLSSGGDVSDWIAAQGGSPTVSQTLERLVEAAADWRPEGAQRSHGQEAAATADDVIRQLDGLTKPADLSEVEVLLLQLGAAAQSESTLRRALLRERAIGCLRGKVQGPAALIDAALREAGPMSDREDLAGTPLLLETAEPWHEPVDGTELLDEVRRLIRNYLILPRSAPTAMALWVLHTYLFDSGWITPRLAITSPVKRCAKTLTLTVLEHLVAKPLLASNVTAAAVFRTVESHQPTLLIDEADTFLDGKDELRGILNSGHRRGGLVLRVTGDDYEPRRFSTFAPVAIAKIGKLPDTLADRSIEIEMRRKAAGEHVESLRLDRLDHFEPVRRRLARWAKEHRDAIRGADPATPAGLNDRAEDNWRPLLAVADAAGGPWPERARRAVAELSVEGEADAASVREDLLGDIREIFEQRAHVDRLFTDTLLEQLRTMEHRPWPEWRKGQPMTGVQLARMLRDFKVRPRSIRIGTETRKGYRVTDFEDAFERYLPPDPSQPSQRPKDGDLRDSATRHTDASVTDRESSQTPANTGSVTGVTAQIPSSVPERRPDAQLLIDEAQAQGGANYWKHPADEVPID